MATITFIDYGNRALVEKTQLAELPAAVSCDVLEGQAKEFQLALVKPPADEVKILETIKVYFINYFQTILFRLFLKCSYPQYELNLIGFPKYCFERVHLNAW